jgi:hypothetical protein
MERASKEEKQVTNESIYTSLPVSLLEKYLQLQGNNDSGEFAAENLALAQIILIKKLESKNRMDFAIKSSNGEITGLCALERNPFYDIYELKIISNSLEDLEQNQGQIKSWLKRKKLPLVIKSEEENNYPD